MVYCACEMKDAALVKAVYVLSMEQNDILVITHSNQVFMKIFCRVAVLGVLAV